jgi:hypothetical protein
MPGIRRVFISASGFSWFLLVAYILPTKEKGGNMKYKLPLAVAGAVAAVGASSVLAFADASTTASGHESLAAKIASAFHLNQADVQKVIDQNRQDHQAQMEQNYEDRLNKAVTDGKITSARKDLILAKHNEVVHFMDSLKDKTPAERKTAVQTERQQLRDWAKQNNVSLEWVMPMHRGMGMGHMGDNDGNGPEGPNETTSD